MPAIRVIDDDSHALAAVEAALRRKRFDVVVARDGRASLDLFKAEKFDAAVIDIFMPEMDGIATIRELRGLDLSITPCVRGVACRYGRSTSVAEGVTIGFPPPREKNPRRRLDVAVRRADG